MTRLVVRISLPDGWREIDPFAALPDRTEDALTRAMLTEILGNDVSAGKYSAVALCATLWDQPDDAELPPLIASMVVHESPDVVVPVSLVDGVGIEPHRHVEVITVQFRGRDVSLLRVSYGVPNPDGRGWYSLVFTTPNLPLREHLEFMFDSIVSTMVWAEH